MLDTKGIFRLIESVPSPKAEPFKMWLASLGKEADEDDFKTLENLNEVSGVEIPTPIANLKGKTPRFKNVCEKENLDKMIFEFLNI